MTPLNKIPGAVTGPMTPIQVLKTLVLHSQNQSPFNNYNANSRANVYSPCSCSNFNFISLIDYVRFTTHTTCYFSLLCSSLYIMHYQNSLYSYLNLVDAIKQNACHANLVEKPQHPSPPPWSPFVAAHFLHYSLTKKQQQQQQQQ